MKVILLEDVKSLGKKGQYLPKPPTCPPPMPPTVWTPPTRRCSPTHSTALKLHRTAGSPLC